MDKKLSKIIPFNKPYLTGKELINIYDAVNSGQISGNGKYTRKCQELFEQNYNFRKTLLTTSCTDALEMAALLLNIKEGDEVIVPSYTFVSTALAFVRQGAKIIFADSRADMPGIDEDKIESLITPRTRVIVPVHYAGIACDMDKIMNLANKHGLFVVEDAAQAVDSYYKGRPLGGIGHLAAFSFHETKNIISGEGGMLVINDERFVNRAEILWEKGTNRAEFFRGEVNKYGWVDTGSSFLPSDIISAFLCAQIENLDKIQSRRKYLWQHYYDMLSGYAYSAGLTLPHLPDYATNNAHMFYIVCKSLEQRTNIINKLGDHDIKAVFHYLSLHKSPYYADKYEGPELPHCDNYADCLLRLPLYYELSVDDIRNITEIIKEA